MTKHLLRLTRGVGVLVVLAAVVAAVVALLIGFFWLLLYLGDLGYGVHMMIVFTVLLLGWIAYDLGEDF